MGWLTETGGGGGLQGLNNSFMGMSSDPSALQSAEVERMTSCGVYGMSAVYAAYAASVLPLVHTLRQNQQIGTGFVLNPACLVTAAHCLEAADTLSLRGVSADQLRRAQACTHRNRKLDLALLVFAEPVFQDLAAIPMPRQPVQILDEVLAMGYPAVAGLLPRRRGGHHLVSLGGVAKRGDGARNGHFLALRSAGYYGAGAGGFSGGPVLDGMGQAVGLITKLPTSEDHDGLGQQYDDLGYGIAIPAEHILALMEDGSMREQVNLSAMAFENFPI